MKTVEVVVILVVSDVTGQENTKDKEGGEG